MANCGRMVIDRGMVTWAAYRKPPSLSRMVPSLTPYDLPFPQNEGPNPKCTTNTEEFQTDGQNNHNNIALCIEGDVR